VSDGCGIEYLESEGVWKRLPALGLWSPWMFTRPAPHDWEDIPPSYRRCRRCGVVVDGEVTR
jgi:hypothetical protein